MGHLCQDWFFIPGGFKPHLAGITTRLAGLPERFIGSPLKRRGHLAVAFELGEQLLLISSQDADGRNVATMLAL